MSNVSSNSYSSGRLAQKVKDSNTASVNSVHPEKLYSRMFLNVLIMGDTDNLVIWVNWDNLSLVNFGKCLRMM